MDDLEMTKLCAKAMGIRGDFADWDDHRWKPAKRRHNFLIHGDMGNIDGIYDPLHDDAQAMALVKRFGLTVMFRDYSFVDPRPYWDIYMPEPESVSRNGDLPRAIVECVAKMQTAKVPA